MPPMYHLDLDAAQIRGARVALLPGDPGRSRLIAERIATAHGGRVAERPLASNREFCTYLAEIAGAPVLVTSMVWKSSGSMAQALPRWIVSSWLRRNLPSPGVSPRSTRS